MKVNYRRVYTICLFVACLAWIACVIEHNEVVYAERAALQAKIDYDIACISRTIDQIDIDIKTRRNNIDSSIKVPNNK